MGKRHGRFAGSACFPVGRAIAMRMHHLIIGDPARAPIFSA